MKIITSYAVEVLRINKLFRQTVKIYNDAVSFCIDVFEHEWSDLEQLEVGNRKRFKYADDLIHSTKTNIAKYPDFDVKFHKLPSYLRFAVINMALGHLSSYHSNLDNWAFLNNGGKEPTLQKHLHKLPTFYKDNMFRDGSNRNSVKLKLFVKSQYKVTFK